MEIAVSAATYERLKDVRDEMQDALDRTLTFNDTVSRLIDEYEKSKKCSKKRKNRRFKKGG